MSIMKNYNINFHCFGHTTILMKGYNAALTIREFNNASITPTVFQVMGDGKTFISQKKIKPTVAHNDAILQVWGKIGCMEMVVLAPSNKWADYVFEKGYKLDKIEEVEQYIKNHGHLKNIPAAKEIVESGMNVSEVIPKLLEKIEEQMLYIIDLKREIIEIRKSKL